jgi:hypothetical protein
MAPDCESSREYEGQDAELGQAAHTCLGSGYLLRVSDPANLANPESHSQKSSPDDELLLIEESPSRAVFPIPRGLQLRP